MSFLELKIHDLPKIDAILFCDMYHSIRLHIRFISAFFKKNAPQLDAVFISYLCAVLYILLKLYSSKNTSYNIRNIVQISFLYEYLIYLRSERVDSISDISN